MSAPTTGTPHDRYRAAARLAVNVPAALPTAYALAHATALRLRSEWLATIPGGRRLEWTR